ncbi:pentatricopeptide repeat-containing protein [Striga asiatica]|uniref:Pentatricopeptide repeat-containing protein n=1 Tax=Striga asiatica TaxID=4170 RepID=A0A5A7Q6Z3_STRAF|nr:pentatricopeptide repeat-containing protein [Striga asiatica]
MYKRISSLSRHRFLHSSSQSLPKTQPSFFPYTEEVIASHLAPLLQQKGPRSPFILRQTQQIHAQITVNGLHKMGILGTRVLGMYILCNSYFDAKILFSQLQLSYAAPWNWMIRGFTTTGYHEQAILFYFKMLVFGTSPDKYTFPYLIKACGGLRAVDVVKHVHCMVMDLGFEQDVYVGSALVKFYAENDCLERARQVFDKLPQRDIVLWNVMLHSYLKSETLADNVIVLFKDMRKTEVLPNYVTYTYVLCLCGSKSIAKLGTQVHGLVVKCGLDTDSSVVNTLLSMYSKCRCLFDARKLFDSVDQPNLVTFNGMIGGYVQNGLMTEALDLFRLMLSSNAKPDSVTFASLLPLVPELGLLDHGKEFHCYIIRHEISFDLFLKNALVDMYFKCKHAKMACRVFEWSPDSDIVVCTAMISGLVLNGMNFEALEIFRFSLDQKMRPNAVTFASVLPACTGLARLKLGKELHGSITRKGLEGKCYVGSALADMYAKCGELDLARKVFDRMPERDSVCWNSMIASLSRNGEPEAAVDLFRQMGSDYDPVSISSALSACADLSALAHSREIHGFMTRNGLDYDIIACSALIDSYAKCGDLRSARLVFDKMGPMNEVSWNSIIAAYGSHGELDECLSLFRQMETENLFEPDHVTFLTVISACSHAGRVEEGKLQFERMGRDYGIKPKMEHYASLIDLYGRAGRLEDACCVIEKMPFEPDAGVWGTLLGACRMHGNVELAEKASKHLSRLDPQNSGYYVLLSNLQGEFGTWARVDEIRGVMKENRVKKIPGYSWVEVDKGYHVFGAGDKSHPQTSRIYEMLSSLLVELQDEGCNSPFNRRFSVPWRPITVADPRRKNLNRITARSSSSDGGGFVLDKDFEFKPSFDEYLKAMESIKTDRDNNSSSNDQSSSKSPRKKKDAKNFAREEGKVSSDEATVAREKPRKDEASKKSALAKVGSRNVALRVSENVSKKPVRNLKNYAGKNSNFERDAFKTLKDDDDAMDEPRVGRVDMEGRIQKLANLNGADIDIPAWQFSKMMMSARIKFSDHSILRVVQILGNLGNWKRVLQVIEWIRARERFKSNRISSFYTSKIKLKIYQEQMASYPDIVAYRCIAVTLGQAGHMKELFDVIDTMRSPPKKKFKSNLIEKWDPRLEPDAVVYNAVLNACVRREKWEGAFWVLQQLSEQGKQPSSTTYGLVMEVMLACGKYDLVHDFFKKIQKSYIPNALIYKVVVNTFWREGKINEAIMAVEEMERRGIVGNAALYYDLARCLCSAGRCHEALRQIDKICKVANKPLVVTYTGLIQACLEAGEVKNGAYIFDHMQKFCSPNVVTCNIMLKAFLDHKMFEEAKQLFLKLVENSKLINRKEDYKARVIPDIYTFNTMLDACGEEKRWDDVEFVYTQMLKFGHHFNAKRHLQLVLNARHVGKGDSASALSIITNFASTESQVYSRKTWSKFLAENATRLNESTLRELVHKGHLHLAVYMSCITWIMVQ